jgi:hypothetical protein
LEGVFLDLCRSVDAGDFNTDVVKPENELLFTNMKKNGGKALKSKSINAK